ncbi:MAG: ATP-binding protein [Kineosporiaceae bacterium]
MELLPRLLRPSLTAALGDTPVVVVHGPRQSGKSTLVRNLLDGRDARYVTLDDLGPRSAATRDPEGFLAGFAGDVVIDEIQRVPALVLAIKAAVDRDRRPGRFLLTGSADVFARSRVDESLAGRRETLRLWPLTQTEIDRSPGVDPGRWFDTSPEALPHSPVTLEDVLARVVRGGYPEAVARDGARRERWFAAYLDEVVRFEIADRSAIEQLTEVPTLLRLVAAQDSGLLNATRLASDLQVSPSTLRRYLALLTEVFVVMLHPAWAHRGRARLVKSPKVLVADSGLSAFLTGADSASPERVGSLLEAFVISELRRLIDAQGLLVDVFHFRSHAQHEVDIVLQDRRGRVVGIEVKSRTSIRSEDFRGLRALAEVAGDRFARGLVLHPGREAVPYGTNLWAVPLSVLWTPPTG